MDFNYPLALIGLLFLSFFMVGFPLIFRKWKSVSTVRMVYALAVLGVFLSYLGVVILKPYTLHPVLSWGGRMVGHPHMQNNTWMMLLMVLTGILILGLLLSYRSQFRFDKIQFGLLTLGPLALLAAEIVVYFMVGEQFLDSDVRREIYESLGGYG